jgi:hypothetical protein
MRKTAYWVLGLLLILPAGSVAAQSQTFTQDTQSTSLAEAARRARETKKDESKQPRVWNNDTIPKAGDEISVVGPSSVANSGDSGATGDNSASVHAGAGASNGAAAKTDGVGTAGVQGRSGLETQIADAKENLATLKTDLDILQRTNTLDSQMYFGKTDYSTDKEGAAKLKDEQDQIAAKQQEMDDQQKKIDDLEAQAARLGPASSKEPASSSEPASSDSSK